MHTATFEQKNPKIDYKDLDVGDAFTWGDAAVPAVKLTEKTFLFYRSYRSGGASVEKVSSHGMSDIQRVQLTVE